jgi:hypothetical protein
MIKRANIVAIMVALVGCADSSIAGPRLSSEQAARLADAKAQTLGWGGSQLQHSAPTYDVKDDSWWVSYERKHVKRGDLSVRNFTIQVEDKTKKTWLVLP